MFSRVVKHVGGVGLRLLIVMVSASLSFAAYADTSASQDEQASEQEAQQEERSSGWKDFIKKGFWQKVSTDLHTKLKSGNTVVLAQIQKHLGETSAEAKEAWAKIPAMLANQELMQTIMQSKFAQEARPLLTEGMNNIKAAVVGGVSDFDLIGSSESVADFTSELYRRAVQEVGNTIQNVHEYSKSSASFTSLMNRINPTPTTDAEEGEAQGGFQDAVEFTKQPAFIDLPDGIIGGLLVAIALVIGAVTGQGVSYYNP